jgi:stage II sporulation protein D
MKIIIRAIMLLAFAATGEVAAQQINLEQEHLARWHINYASYLIDVGKYMEALENYNTAIELTSLPKTRSDAMLAKATLLSSFLDADEEALKVYQEISRSLPDGAEIATYREGLLLYELNRYEDAKEAFSGYISRYPEGRFRFQAEALLEKVEETLAKATRPAVKQLKPVHAGGGPEMRVRTAKAASYVLMSGKAICGDGLGCKDSIKVSADGGRLVIGGSRTGASYLIFKSGEPITVTCDGKKKKLRGRISLKARDDKLLVLNLVEMEDYLRSVVPSESYATWPLETLKAQAVAARTYAYYQKLHRENLDYDLVDDEGDQAYKGMERENARSSKAVEDCAGEILTVQGRPILAMFSANSGGYTADAKAVFNLNKGYLTARPDPDSLKGKMAFWTREFTVSEVEESLARIGISARGMTRIEPAEKGPSGRIIKVRISSRDGEKVYRTRTTLGRALKLPEILLEIKKQRGKYVFEGRGWGHGVGYSQWGAAEMGKEKSYREILAFYYPGTSLEKKW